MNARECRRRACARFTVAALLAVMAFFAATACADPCAGDECDGTDCHILCVDGCTNTLVSAFSRCASPLASVTDDEATEKPLYPSAPDLDDLDKPPRAAV